MKNAFKILAFIVLTACVIGFGYGFIKNLPKAREIVDPGSEPTNVLAVGTNTTNTITTNAPATNSPATNMAAQPATNLPVAIPPPAKSSARWGTYLGLFLLSGIALGLLLAYEIAHFLAHRAEQFVFDESLVVEKDPEYEEAEKMWANGKPLEAVQMLRNFLNKNPHAQYVALRIAEIYEKDLGNYLAAALEYEELLKKKLPPERWGWAAIHLANLYSGKLNKMAQAEALLRRINDEHPRTGAAKKARERLGLPEPIVVPEPEPEMAEEPEEEEPEPAPPPPPPPNNLPPGFRPKS